MVGDDYGIRWLPTYVETDAPEAQFIANYPPVNRMLTASEHPFPWDSALRYDTMYVETGRYLRQMIRDVQIAGGKIEVRRFATPADIAALPESAGVQLHRPRHRASCSATRSCIRSAASSRSSSRSPRYATRRSASSATCSRAATASCWAGRSSDDVGTRRRTRRRSPGSSPVTSASSRRLPLHRLNRPCRASNIAIK